MLNRLKQLFKEVTDDPSALADEDAGPMAASMLLLEVAWADHDISDEEVAHISTAITRLFGLSPGQVERLVENARAHHEDSISMHPYTRRLNETLSLAEKKHLVTDLWRLAFADDYLHAHEEHSIRRIADLLYVPHKDFIAAKLAARESGD
jgi:uncharacterized tellurite resistance protein B-like protein